MERVPNGRYTKEFQEESVKLVTEGGLSVPEGGRRLSLPPSTLNTWVKTYRAGKLGEVGKTRKPLTEVELELAKVRREMTEVKMEQDRNLLEKFGMKASMSRQGNCYDNAPMESFWGTLKSELVHHRRYITRQEAIQDITEYIEIFYNRQRRQAKLGFMSPAAYEKQFYNRQLVA